MFGELLHLSVYGLLQLHRISRARSFLVGIGQSASVFESLIANFHCDWILNLVVKNLLVLLLLLIAIRVLMARRLRQRSLFPQSLCAPITMVWGFRQRVRPGLGVTAVAIFPTSCYIIDAEQSTEFFLILGGSQYFLNVIPHGFDVQQLDIINFVLAMLLNGGHFQVDLPGGGLAVALVPAARVVDSRYHFLSIDELSPVVLDLGAWVADTSHSECYLLPLDAGGEVLGLARRLALRWLNIMATEFALCIGGGQRDGWARGLGGNAAVGRVLPVGNMPGAKPVSQWLRIIGCAGQSFCIWHHITHRVCGDCPELAPEIQICVAHVFVCIGELNSVRTHSRARPIFQGPLVFGFGGLDDVIEDVAI